MSEEPIENTVSRLERYDKGNVDLRYSDWHRQLAKTSEYKHLYVMDGDWIEARYRDGAIRVVGIIETRGTDTYLNKFQWSVLLDLHARLNVPVLFVRYNQDLTLFRVTPVRALRQGETELPVWDYNEKDYIEKVLAKL